jgi:asparagine synthase (glutamine-hydrolysing)
MRRRGPDGQGDWIHRHGTVGLSHARLAIIDPTDKAAQPMSTPDGNLVIVFNGAIYNYRELRELLASRGYRFESRSDTEVLLHLYREFGESMLGRLRGMFSFALWDEEASTLFCARDLYGIKPFYYSDDGKTLRIASQVRALLRADIHSREQDPAGLVGFYLFGHVPEPFTMFRSIRALPAGGVLISKTGDKPRIKRFARVGEIYSRASVGGPKVDGGIGRLERCLADSVTCHMVSDVPVGLFLSAGIDSGLILSLLKKAGHDGLRTFTVTFDEYAGLDEDEAPTAAMIAATCGARHETAVLSESEVREHLPDFLEAMDQPSIDGLNTWLVSRAASRCGLKVALSGVGGDELFGSYPSYRDLPRWCTLFGRSASVPGLNALISAALASLRKLGMPVHPKLAALPTLAGRWPGAYLARRGLFMPSEIQGILGRELAEAGLDRLRPLALIESEITPDPGNGFARTAALESGLYMKNQLLRDTDWASMDHSMEVRTPFVDHTLLKRVAPELKSADGRVTKMSIARRIAGNPPSGWSERSKTGFTVPIDRWLQTAGDFDVWRRVPQLRESDCHWARRWAYTILAMTPCAAA